MAVKETNDAIEITDGKHLIVFGRRNLSKEQIAERYPKYEFFHLKQVHGDWVMESKRETLNADAHWTTQANGSPVVVTADCMPVIIIHPKVIFGIHAGWRGVQKNIIHKSLQKMKAHGFAPSEARVYIGPHIQAESFEVGDDVAASLLNAHTEYFSGRMGVEQLLSAKHPHSDTGKSFIDLTVLARAQIKAGGVPENAVWISEVDTKTDMRFASYRRDGGAASRQYSFAIRLD